MMSIFAIRNTSLLLLRSPHRQTDKLRSFSFTSSHYNFPTLNRDSGIFWRLTREHLSNTYVETRSMAVEFEAPAPLSVPEFEEKDRLIFSDSERVNPVIESAKWAYSVRLTGPCPTSSKHLTHP